MTERLDVLFAPLDAPQEALSVILAGNDLAFGSVANGLDKQMGGQLMRSAGAADFTGKAKSSLEILGNPEIKATRLLVVGAGKTAEAGEKDWLMLGGYVAGLIAQRKAETALVVAEVGDVGERSPADFAADIGMGAILRAYSFKKYKTKKKGAEDSRDDAEGDGGEKGGGEKSLRRLVIATAEPDKARAAFAARQAVAEGVMLARDLVNEPANVLGPVEFADRVGEIRVDGLEIEVLDDAQLKALKMNTLLGVAQGSIRPARVVVMRWQGAKSKRAKPVCFVGKGVTFDTGGISIKPSGGMEEMKGDMGGAAAVVGVMQALAARKAKVNAVGIVGLVENMPSHTAQRPGDIVTSMSGQTVEVLNTDAEGRLVLADCMWYAQERFEPKVMIDLATLTGAIIVALGKEYAGLFSTDDKLAGDLVKAGEETGERVWRMPLDKAYDKLLDSPNADMKNIGGRNAGSITAAQFLGRFIKDTPWAHLDVAGVAFASGKTEISQGWASGWGVRLLDRYVALMHER
ncbi:MAG: hypothetical protein RLZ98_2976 [Pseudomonadota bacterium]|jgi:leucyl aminopeptidase